MYIIKNMISNFTKIYNKQLTSEKKDNITT